MKRDFSNLLPTVKYSFIFTKQNWVTSFSILDISHTSQSKTQKLKLVSVIFHQIFIFYQMMALQKLWIMFFISSKKLFRGWFKENLKVYDVINYLNKNLIMNFVWYLFFFVFKLGFTPCKAEQPLRGMELQEKKHEKDCRIQKICLERTYS